MKYLHYRCNEVCRKIELEEIVNPNKMSCKGKKHLKIPHQCVSMVRWKASPHLLNSGIRMRCRRKSVNGTTVCAVHGATPPKRLEDGSRMRSGNRAKNKMEYFETEIAERIEAFKQDVDLEKVELELAYLKSLNTRIESSDLSDEKKFKLLQKNIDLIFKNTQVREVIIEQRRYSLGLEKVQLLMKLVFEAVKKHVKEPEIIKKIGKEIQGIAVQMKNLDDERMLPAGRDDEIEIEINEAEEDIKVISTKKKKRVKR